MKVFATGNQQFGRIGAIKKYNRPFKTVEEMNNTLIDSWNNTVSSKDSVYVLGNLFWDPLTADDIIRRLNGNIFLMRGDYDRATEDIEELHPTKLKIIDSEIHVDDNNKLCFSHWPLSEWRNKSKGYYSITAFPGKKYKSDHKQLRINVNCDAWSFRPVEVSSIKGLFEELVN
jgi:calcineurin-like phosphoesterase family protein